MTRVILQTETGYNTQLISLLKQGLAKWKLLPNNTKSSNLYLSFWRISKCLTVRLLSDSKCICLVLDNIEKYVSNSSIWNTSTFVIDENKSDNKIMLDPSTFVIIH
jgi:hypothetical protein